MNSAATPSTVVTVTTTEAHVHQFFEIWPQGNHKTSPFSKSNPLALALFEQTGLPIQVYCEHFTLHGETITLEGLPEDVRAFVGGVSGVLREMGWDGWKSDRKCRLGLKKMLALVPFRFEFDTMGLGEDSGSEAESVFRQNKEAESSPQGTQTPIRHTPGDWVFSLVFDQEGHALASDTEEIISFYQDSNGATHVREICTVMLDADGQDEHPGGPQWLEDVANGYLMSASSDMFSAISAVLAYEDSLQREETGIPCPAQWAEALALCRAAIAKTEVRLTHAS